MKGEILECPADFGHQTLLAMHPDPPPSNETEANGTFEKVARASCPPKSIGGYRLEQQIGRGGMSQVFQGRRNDGDAPAAVKVLDARVAVDPSMRQRFIREIKAIQAIQSPHIVPLYDYGEDNGTPYLVMKLIDGVTLSELIWCLKQRRDETEYVFSGEDTSVNDEASTLIGPDGGLEARAAACLAAIRTSESIFCDLARLIATAADAIDEAHRHGIVHRDIKPSNLMIDRTGNLWLTDFGLASIDEAQTAVTRTGEMVGTPNYMSPEQANADRKAVDYRTDIYSLGATLYEVSTLRRPYQGERFRVLLEISTGQLTPPSKISPDIPRPLESIILKAMQYSPSDRYRSGVAMAEDLRRFAAGKAISARQPHIAEHVGRWIVRNPRLSLASAVGMTTIVMLVIALFALDSNRLQQANELEKRSKEIYRELSEDLKDTNAALSKSRSEFRRHLYIADLAEAYRSYGNWDIDGVIQRLSPYRPQDNDLVDEIRGEDQDLRGFEWRLLMALCAPPESKLLGQHKGTAYEVTSIPGTDEFLSSGGDGHVRRWHLDSGNLATFELDGEINALAVSADGKYFVSGQNGSGKAKQMAIYRVEDGGLVQELKRHRNSVESVAFSPDGRFVATADRYRDLFLHTIDGEFTRSIWTGSRNESLAFTPDGKAILAVVRNEKGKESLGVYSVPELEEQRRLHLPFNIKFFSFSGDRKRLVAAGSDWIAIYSWPACKLLAIDNAPRGGICQVALNGEGNQLVAGFDNGLLFTWELDQLSKDSDELPRPLVMSTGKQSITSITFTPSQRMVLCTGSGEVQVWETINHQELPLRLDQTVKKVSAESADAEDMAVRLRDGSVARFNFHRRDFEVIQNVPPDRHLYVARSPDKKLIVASAPGELFALSAETGQIIKRMKVQIPNDPTDGLVFTADGSRLLHLLNDRFEIYSVGPRAEDWKKIGERLFNHDGVYEITVSPNAAENVVAVATTSDLIIFEGADFKQRDRLPEQFGGFKTVRYSDDGSRLAVGYDDGTVEVLRGKDLATLATMKGHQGDVNACVWIAENQTLVTGSDDEIRFWDVPSGRALGMFHSEKIVNDLHYCPADDSLFSFVDNAPIEVWDAN